MQKIGTLGQARSARYRLPDFPRPSITPRVGNLKLEIDDLERRAIERSLAERRSRLIEMAGDTTLTPARRQASYRELSAIASALRKLRRQICSAKSQAWVARRTASPVGAR